MATHPGDTLPHRRVAPFVIEIDRDLREPMDDETGARFVDLLRASGVLILRGQTLSPREQAAVLGRFGRIPPTDGSGFISNVADERGAGTSALSFHSDYAWAEDPIQCISLHGVEMEGASSTLFCSTVLPLGTMPREMLSRLDTLRAEMIAPAGDLGARACDLDDVPRLLSEVRDVVRRHPVTGEAYIAVNEMHTTRLVGLPVDESRRLLTRVYDAVYAPANIYEHGWREGDIVIWDNLTVQHARGDVSRVGRRVLQRVMVARYGLDEMYPALLARFAAA